MSKNDGTASAGHYNPNQVGHALPLDPIRHVGDMVSFEKFLFFFLEPSFLKQKKKTREIFCSMIQMALLGILLQMINLLFLEKIVLLEELSYFIKILMMDALNLLGMLDLDLLSVSLEFLQTFKFQTYQKIVVDFKVLQIALLMLQLNQHIGANLSIGQLF